jgi:hypothetical protein
MILSLYAKGLTTGEIQAHLGEIYEADVSRELISKVTDAVNDDLAAWRSRPLDRIYAGAQRQQCSWVGCRRDCQDKPHGSYSKALSRVRIGEARCQVGS